MISIPSSIMYFILGFITCLGLVIIACVQMIRKAANDEVERTKNLLEILEKIDKENKDD